MKDPNRGLSEHAWVTRLIITGLLLLIPLAAEAEDVRTTVSLEDDLAMESLPSDAGELGLNRVDDKVELRLEDAIALTLQRNLSLVVERYRRSQSIQGIQEAMGIFDLELGSTARLSEDTTPATSLLVEAEGNTLVDESILWNFDLSQLTRFGGTATLSFNNNRFETSDTRRQPNPVFSVDFDLSYTQPLLRNFGKETTYNGVLVARNNSAISRETFRLEVETLVLQVSDQYWLLVEALEQLKVTEESLALAKELHDMNRIQVEVGTMAPLEMVQSEAGVATREEEIITRLAAVDDSADALRRFLNLDEATYWDVDIVPVTDPITEYVEVDFAKAYSTALAKRTDIESQRLDNDNRGLAARLARNRRKARLDVTVGYGVNGVDGEGEFPQDGEPPLIVNNGYSDALQQILDRDSDGFFVQAVFAYPLQNRAAKAQSLRADLNLKQGELEMRDLEQQVLLDVRSLARDVRTAQQQIESAKVSTKLQRKNLEAEQKRYENGLSTSFEVLQIQEDLTEAQSREVSAITNYRRALNAFYASTGEILEVVGVELVGEDDDVSEAGAP